jgi:hypothetical protein
MYKPSYGYNTGYGSGGTGGLGIPNSSIGMGSAAGYRPMISPDQNLHANKSLLGFGGMGYGGVGGYAGAFGLHGYGSGASYGGQSYGGLGGYNGAGYGLGFGSAYGRNVGTGSNATWSTNWGGW